MDDNKYDSPISNNNVTIHKTPLSTSRHLTPCRSLGLRRHRGTFKTPLKNASNNLSENVKSVSSPKLESFNFPITKRELFTGLTDDCSDKSLVTLNANNSSLLCKDKRKHQQSEQNDLFGQDKKRINLNSTVCNSTSNFQISEDTIKLLRDEVQLKRSKLLNTSSHDLKDVKSLRKMILVWKDGCREAINELLKSINTLESPETLKSIGDVLEALNISSDLIEYDPLLQDYKS